MPLGKECSDDYGYQVNGNVGHLNNYTLCESLLELDILGPNLTA